MISIIIPALNEENTISKTLNKINESKGDYEIIVADGKSKDKTREIAKKYAKIITCSKGRACQMNCGAKLAKGEILFFLHADTLINEETIKLLNKIEEEKDIVGGANKIEFDSDNIVLKIIAWGSNLRISITKSFYGDQGIFVRKSVFKKLGGYREMPLFEDVEFSKRLRNYASNRDKKLKIISAKIKTSGRRFEKAGYARSFLFIQYIKILYYSGYNIHKIKKMYYDFR